AADPNNYVAAKQMSYYLEPRWYGSQDECLAFARTCVASTNWGGRVPLVLVQTHRSLAESYDLSNSPAYWQKPEGVADVQASYERLFELNHGEVGRRHDYAKDAYFCGLYEIFLKQVTLFTDRTNFALFGGEPKFQEMLQKATAAARKKSP